MSVQRAIPEPELRVFYVVEPGEPTAWGGPTVRIRIAQPNHAEPKEAFVYPPARNAKVAKFRSRTTKCSACCAYTDKPCDWALCPQRERA